MCLHPIQIKYKDYLGFDRYLSAPCGKCAVCLRSQQNGWSIRLYEESRCWKYLVFVTFTYKNDSLPYIVDDSGLSHSTVYLKDVSSCIKRFRTKFSRLYDQKADFKYFVCSEYGSRSTKRPHYHGLFFFNFDPIHFGLLLDDWSNRFGFVHHKVVDASSKSRLKTCRYVSKYITKTCYQSRKSEIERGLINPCSFIMSKGIGSNYVSRMMHYHRPDIIGEGDLNSIIERMYYTFDGRVKYALPRYYKDRFFRKLVIKHYYDAEFSNDLGAVSYSYRKVVKRYTSENFLSVAIADFTRNRYNVEFLRSLKQRERYFLSSLGDSARYKAIADEVSFRKSLDEDSRSLALQRLADDLTQRAFTDFHSEPLY